MKTTNKIFGIGLPRTGTTSLHLALQHLGISSVHFPFSLWEDGEFALLDQYDAFCDGPIYAMYDDLDLRCPDSSFVLTTRPLDGWLDSMEWLLKNGPSLWSWSPAYDRFHAEFFGSACFDRKLYSETFRRHHETAYRWSERNGRPLLVLDSAQGYGFNELCEFLNMPVPTAPYPRSNPARPPSLLLRCLARCEQISPSLGSVGRRLVTRWGCA